jgi:hypothetical protein
MKAKLQKINAGWYSVMIGDKEIGQVEKLNGYWVGRVTGVKFSGILANTRKEAFEEVLKKYS